MYTLLLQAMTVLSLKAWAFKSGSMVLRLGSTFLSCVTFGQLFTPFVPQFHHL